VVSHVREKAYTLVEVVVVCAIIGVLAVVGVLSISRLSGAAAVPTAAVRFAAVLRESQALAQVGGEPVNVIISPSASYRVFLDSANGPVWLASGDLAPVICSSNYPGGSVAFSPQGWPCAVGSRIPRAGTFSFTYGGSLRSVVVQMGGCIRCR